MKISAGTHIASTLGNIKRIHFVGVGGTGMSGHR